MVASADICPTMLAYGLRAERMKFDWTQGALAEGLRLYQEGEFFAAHETWGERLAGVAAAGEDVLARVDSGDCGVPSPPAE